MNKRVIVSTVGAVVLAFSPQSGHAAQLLLNGNFESPVQTGTGNHTGVVPDSWIVAPNITDTASTAADSNLNRGTVTNGTGVTSSAQYLGICPDDPTGQQSLDGVNATVYVSQSFTLAAASQLEVKVDFGGRDSTSGSTTGSSWEILNSAGTAVYISAAYQPATGSWVKSDIIPNINFASGTYRFVATLTDPDMMDAASITNVPEPTAITAAGLGAGLLGWLGLVRRRKS